MSIVESLASAAYEDTKLLIKNNSLGDDFSIPRNVDFVFRADQKQKADTVASFIQDNQYGTPHIESTKTDFRVIITINMPATQQLLCSVSGLMVCIAELFAVEYDGWGCALQRRT